MKRLIVFVCMLLFISSMSVFADEGMWLPHQMKMLNLQEQGLKMDPGELFKEDGTGLMSAIVSFGGGTGEFVSNNGLLLTNHHVAFGAIQRASDKENNYIRDGFHAPELGKEIPAIGYYADVLLGYVDVTEKFHKVLKDDMAPMERFDAIEALRKKLVAEVEAQAPDRRCVVRSFYSGNKYYLFQFKRLRDIRLVYAPPQSIGNYGGDIDNWMWPRHTGDFTFMRAYVSPDGEGSEFDQNNVPYKPKSWLKLSLDGLKPGDFTFVMGYPGRTYRNMTLAEFQNDKKQIEEQLGLFKMMLTFLEGECAKDEAVNIRYASLTKGINNYLKNMEGKLEGFENVNLEALKAKQEKKFRTWCAEDNARADYAGYLDKVADHLDKLTELELRSLFAGFLVNGFAGPAVLSQAHLLHRVALEQAKPDMEREAGFQDRDLPGIRNRIQFRERGYELGTDRAFLKFLLTSMLDKPESQWPGAVSDVLKGGEAAIGPFVDKLYDGTKLADPEVRLSLLGKSMDELKALNDPMLDLAASLETELKALREEGRALGQEHQDLKGVVVKGMMDMNGGLFAPDANSTIRFTSGTVKGYQPKDGVWYTPFTTLAGVMEKETGEDPFIVPEKLKQLHAAKDFGRYEDPKLKDVVTCFLNTTNVTGGNSGSPILNARGEQVGIVFDMTYESVIGDYFVLPALQRTIHVDIRYVLFVTEKFGGAEHLLKEMGL